MTLKFSFFALGMTLWAGCLEANSQENMIKNGDFEIGTRGWMAFVPQDAKESDCKLEVSSEKPHGGAQSLKISCASDARFAVTHYLPPSACVPGDRYRVTLWVRAGDDFQIKSGTPGFALRMSFFADGATFGSVPGGNFHLTMGNHTKTGSAPPAGDDLSKEWTKLEAVFAIPDETKAMNVALFIWKGNGSLYIDDLLVEKVDASTPLSE